MRTLMLASLVSVFGLSCQAPIPADPFPLRVFHSAQVFSVGSSSCEALNDQLTTRFILRADDESSIREYEPIEDVVVEPASVSISFLDSAQFELPDDTACNGSCSTSGMRCEPPPGGAADRCHAPVEITPTATRFVGTDTVERYFGVLVENSGSMLGFLPADVGALHPDTDGDGMSDGPTDLAVNPGRASDPQRMRDGGLRSMAYSWATQRDIGDAAEKETWFGFWQFPGAQESARSLVGSRNPWTNAEDVSDLVADTEPVEPTRARIYASMLDVLQSSFADLPEEAQKVFVVVVDGPDDLRTPGAADAVSARAQELGVTVVIVHLDAEAETAVRDDPAQWSPGFAQETVQPSCASDAECQSFETCRVPTAYATSPNAPVEIDPAGESFCMPMRDLVSGRIGPIDDFQQLACETGGGYLYVRDAGGIRLAVERLPHLLDGWWEVDATAELGPGRTSLQTTLSVTIDETTRTTARAEEGSDAFPGPAGDTRDVLTR